MKKKLLIGCVLLMAVFLVVYGLTREKQNDNSNEESKKEIIDIEEKDQDKQSLDDEDILSKSIKNPKIALVAPDGSKLALSDLSSKFGCNDVIVFKELDGEFTPKQILETMFVFQDSNDDEGWYYNVFKSSNLIVDSLDIDSEGLLKVQLSGDLRTGGTCDNPRVLAQIDSTLEAMQIMTIKNIGVFINGEPVGDFLSEKD